MQDTFDNLYQESKQDKRFYNLYDQIISDRNILLAYRTIKSNAGSKTAGTDELIIDDLKSLNPNELISYIRETLGDYKPKAVKRVLIPKESGGKRPLGIPTIIDRLIQ